MRYSLKNILHLNIDNTYQYQWSLLMKNKDNNETDQHDDQKTNQSRRDFLRKSKYAAYATPLVTGLIIHSNAAHASGADGSTGFS